MHAYLTSRHQISSGQISMKLPTVFLVMLKCTFLFRDCAKPQRSGTMGPGAHQFALNLHCMQVIAAEPLGRNNMADAAACKAAGAPQLVQLPRQHRLYHQTFVLACSFLIRIRCCLLLIV